MRRQRHKPMDPITVCAVVLTALILLLVASLLLGRYEEERRREEMLKREPWRNYVVPERRYDHNPR